MTTSQVAREPLRTVPTLREKLATLREVARVHAAESERLRTLAPELVAALRQSGLLGLAVPRELGGGEQGPSSQVQVFEAAARIDTALGWSFMISALLAAVAGAYLPAEGAHEVFAHGIPTCAGMIMPSGVLRPVAGGFRVSGRWAFGSGIHHADWVLSSGIVAAGEGPSAPANAPPLMRTFIVPTHQVCIEDTWHVAGLRGTGSDHYHIEDVFVPESRVFRFPDGPAQRGGPVFDLPLVATLMPAHAGFALGAGQAAIDAIVAVAPQRTKTWSGAVLAEHAGFLMELGRSDAKLRAARALVHEAAQLLEERAAAQAELAPGDWSTLRLAVSHATEVAVEAASLAFRAGGASALYESSSLQRILRDVQACAQHVAATDDAYEFAARVLLCTAAPHPLTMPRMKRSAKT